MNDTTIFLAKARIISQPVDLTLEAFDVIEHHKKAIGCAVSLGGHKIEPRTDGQLIVTTMMDFEYQVDLDTESAEQVLAEMIEAINLDLDLNILPYGHPYKAPLS